MPQPNPPSRSRAASGLAAGSVGAGLLAYVFFAASTRALGPSEAAPVAVLWSYWGFAAAGLTFPVQHWIARTAAAAGEGAVRARAATLLRIVLVVVVTTGAVAWLARDALFGGDARFAVLTALVSAGAAAMGAVRGLLGAQHRYPAMGVLLVSENLARCLVCGVLVALDVRDPFLYGVALVLGYVACAGWASVWRARPGPGTTADEADAGSMPARFLGGAAGAQVVGHAVLTGGPVLLAVLGAAPAEVTALFATLALYRAPYTVLQGQVSQATGTLTALVVAGRLERAAAVERWLLVLTAAGLVVGAAVGAGPGPWLVRLVFGPGVRVETGVSIALAVGSVLALATLVQGVVLLAYGSPHRTLLAWLLGLVPSAVVLVAAPWGPTATIAAAFVVAEGAAWLLLVAATYRARSALSPA